MYWKTASGTLADGDTTIVNTDGTVSAVGQTGSPYWIATLGIAYQHTGKGISVDAGNSNYGTAVVGTVCLY